MPNWAGSFPIWGVGRCHDRTGAVGLEGLGDDLKPHTSKESDIDLTTAAIQKGDGATSP